MSRRQRSVASVVTFHAWAPQGIKTQNENTNSNNFCLPRHQSHLKRNTAVKQSDYSDAKMKKKVNNDRGRHKQQNVSVQARARVREELNNPEQIDAITTSNNNNNNKARTRLTLDALFADNRQTSAQKRVNSRRV